VAIWRPFGGNFVAFGDNLYAIWWQFGVLVTIWNNLGQFRDNLVVIWWQFGGHLVAIQWRGNLVTILWHLMTICNLEAFWWQFCGIL
jgi:hypothetical protein